ncbi:ArsR/SmtB family transcription factor [Oceanibacterium hippocampi]|uniref:Putative methyltransferase YcgJ n=1 Tax=Oceanibacterium hippocampi TaxID=745714 RepID=A0A1Y5SBU3_9PROT|nr:metalloregulator ArsR/SmtB family transcription factor [Oceanibacterium hippocampi]SLN37046.1 putative methyltransferase YcgJ [Oceanibacterium hippocampi]
MEALLQALKAAGEPTRLRLLALCARGELTVTELTQILGQSQPRISRHLKLLCDAGLLNRFREGSWAFYRLAHAGPGGEIAERLIGLIDDDDPARRRDLARLDDVKGERARAAAAYFRANAARWDEIRTLYIAEAAVEEALLEFFADREIGNFLDIGTGTGRILQVFGPRVGQGIGIDMSHEMLAIARESLERAELRNCQVRHGDMYHLPLEDRSVDAVAIHQVMHFADDPQAVIREAGRVLRPEGRLAIVDFAPHDLEFLRTEHEHRRLGFEDGEVAEWCSLAGLRPIPPRRLDGEPLTVSLWAAENPARDVPATAVQG